MKDSAVDQSYWDNSYEKLDNKYDENLIEFKDKFDEYLVPRNIMSCFEIGCYPGNYSIYLCKKYSCTFNGIDTTPYVLSKLPNYLKENNVKIGNLYHGNFLKFRSDQKYDIVCSFGFVEHFIDLESVIQKHIELVKPLGYLIITCPNFRKIQYFLHKYLDSSNLERHIIKNMDLDLWKDIISTKEDMEILYLGYQRTAGFWTDSPNPNFFRKITANVIRKTFKLIDKYVNWPNSLISPHMICIARKKDE